MVHELGSQPEDWGFDVDFEEAHALCFSQDGTGLLVAGSAGKYEYWNVREQRRVLQNVLHLDRIQSVAVAPNGKWAALGGEISNEPSDATAGSACVVVIDLGNGSEVVRLDGGSFPVTDLQFSTQGTLLAASSGYRAQSSGGSVFRKITVWDTSEWKVFSDLQIDSSSMARLRFSSDDRFLTAGTNPSSHAVLDVKSGRWRLFSSSDRTVRRFGARMSHEGTMELLDWKGNTLSAKSSPEFQLRMQIR
ncbi:MAG: WD40 repeat domain-containing protein [Fuerstia sp.]|nr:WD40 repeat domain-containing protein [Fuerstiella sp.]